MHCEIGLNSDSGYTHGTSWILHGDFNLLATSSGYQGTLVETLQVHTVISTSWLRLLGTRVHSWNFLCWVHGDFNLLAKSSGNQGHLWKLSLGPHSAFNFLATSSSKPGYTIRTLVPCTVDPLFGTLLGTVDPTFWTCSVLVQGHMCCAGAWFCTWRDHIHQGCTFFSAWWPETLSPCLAATCLLVSVPQQVSYSSVTTWAFFLLNCYT